MAKLNGTTITPCELNNTCPRIASPQDYFTESCADSYCIPMVVCIIIVCVVGLVANAFVLIVIGLNQKLHRPTFMTIVQLCSCDFTFLLFRFSRYIINGYFGKSWALQTYIIVIVLCDSVGIVAGTASVVTLVMLSLMRYAMVVHPLWSHVNITNKKVMLVSGAVWFFGCLISALYMYTVVINTRNDPYTAKVVNITLTVLINIVPLVIIGVLHVYKARTLRASLAACKRNTTKQMSKIVTIVIVGYIITTTPANARDIIGVTASVHRYESWLIIYGHVGRLMLFLNYTINPFIYFVHSDQLKKYAKCFRSKTTRKSTSRGTNLGSSQTQKESVSGGPSIGCSKTSVSHISDGGTSNATKEPATVKTDTEVSDTEYAAIGKL